MFVQDFKDDVMRLLKMRDESHKERAASGITDSFSYGQVVGRHKEALALQEEIELLFRKRLRDDEEDEL